MATTQKIEATSILDCDPFYIESTLPNGVTIAEYRRSRPPRPTLWRRLRALAA
jgi:hypothetical protein